MEALRTATTSARHKTQVIISSALELVVTTAVSIAEKQEQAIMSALAAYEEQSTDNTAQDKMSCKSKSRNSASTGTTKHQEN